MANAGDASAGAAGAARTQRLTELADGQQTAEPRLDPVLAQQQAAAIAAVEAQQRALREAHDNFVRQAGLTSSRGDVRVGLIDACGALCAAGASLNQALAGYRSTLPTAHTAATEQNSAPAGAVASDQPMNLIQAAVQQARQQANSGDLRGSIDTLRQLPSAASLADHLAPAGWTPATYLASADCEGPLAEMSRRNAATPPAAYDDPNAFARLAQLASTLPAEANPVPQAMRDLRAAVHKIVTALPGSTPAQARALLTELAKIHFVDQAIAIAAASDMPPASQRQYQATLLNTALAHSANEPVLAALLRMAFPRRTWTEPERQVLFGHLIMGDPIEGLGDIFQLADHKGTPVLGLVEEFLSDVAAGKASRVTGLRDYVSGFDGPERAGTMSRAQLVQRYLELAPLGTAQSSAALRGHAGGGADTASGQALADRYISAAQQARVAATLATALAKLDEPGLRAALDPIGNPEDKPLLVPFGDSFVPGDLVPVLREPMRVAGADLYRQRQSRLAQLGRWAEHENGEPLEPVAAADPQRLLLGVQQAYLVDQEDVRLGVDGDDPSADTGGGDGGSGGGSHPGGDPPNEPPAHAPDEEDNQATSEKRGPIRNPASPSRSPPPHSGTTTDTTPGEVNHAGTRTRPVSTPRMGLQVFGTVGGIAIAVTAALATAVHPALSVGLFGIGGAVLAAYAARQRPTANGSPLREQVTARVGKVVRAPVTSALVAANVAVYAVMAVLSGNPWSPSGAPLFQHLALHPATFGAGPAGQLVTSAFLQFSPLHLLLNSAALLLFGSELERAVGGRRTAGTYAGTMLTAGLAAAYLSHATMVAGASGAIFGLIGALAGRELLATGSMRRMAIPVLLNGILTVSMPGISIPAHLAGLAAGFLGTLVAHRLRRAVSGGSTAAQRRTVTTAVTILAGAAITVTGLRTAQVLPGSALAALSHAQSLRLGPSAGTMMAVGFGSRRGTWRGRISRALGMVLVGGLTTLPAWPLPMGSQLTVPSAHSNQPNQPSQPTTPARQLYNGTGLYPRLVRLAHTGTANGTLVASIVGFDRDGGIGRVFASTDNGQSFTPRGTIRDPAAAHGLATGTLYELPRQVGAMPAGTLLWAASMGGDVTVDRRMVINLWFSTDQGATWQFLSTARKAANSGGIWEPEFSVDATGRLVMHFSDETQFPRHSQVLAMTATTDGIHWSPAINTVAFADPAMRPGMAVVRKLGQGRYVMTYELHGTGDKFDGAVHLRFSSDGADWSAPSGADRVITDDAGRYFVRAPTVTVAADGRTLFVVGQQLLNADGSISSASGHLVLVHREFLERGNGNWTMLPAPVAVAVPPASDPGVVANYSTVVEEVPHGLIGLATEPDGKTYYRVMPLPDNTLGQPKQGFAERVGGWLVGQTRLIGAIGVLAAAGLAAVGHAHLLAVDPTAGGSLLAFAVGRGVLTTAGRQARGAVRRYVDQLAGLRDANARALRELANARFAPKSYAPWLVDQWISTFPQRTDEVVDQARQVVAAGLGYPVEEVTEQDRQSTTRPAPANLPKLLTVAEALGEVARTHRGLLDELDNARRQPGRRGRRGAARARTAVERAAADLIGWITQHVPAGELRPYADDLAQIFTPATPTTSFEIRQLLEPNPARGPPSSRRLSGALQRQWLLRLLEQLRANQAAGEDRARQELRHQRVATEQALAGFDDTSQALLRQARDAGFGGQALVRLNQRMRTAYLELGRQRDADSPSWHQPLRARTIEKLTLLIAGNLLTNGYAVPLLADALHTNLHISSSPMYPITQLVMGLIGIPLINLARPLGVARFAVGMATAAVAGFGLLAVAPNAVLAYGGVGLVGMSVAGFWGLFFHLNGENRARFAQLELGGQKLERALNQVGFRNVMIVVATLSLGRVPYDNLAHADWRLALGLGVALNALAGALSWRYLSRQRLGTVASAQELLHNTWGISAQVLRQRADARWLAALSYFFGGVQATFDSILPDALRAHQLGVIVGPAGFAFMVGGWLLDRLSRYIDRHPTMALRAFAATAVAIGGGLLAGEVGLSGPGLVIAFVANAMLWNIMVETASTGVSVATPVLMAGRVDPEQHLAAQTAVSISKFLGATTGSLLGNLSAALLVGAGPFGAWMAGHPFAGPGAVIALFGLGAIVSAEGFTHTVHREAGAPATITRASVRTSLLTRLLDHVDRSLTSTIPRRIAALPRRVAGRVAAITARLAVGARRIRANGEAVRQLRNAMGKAAQAGQAEFDQRRHAAEQQALRDGLTPQRIARITTTNPATARNRVVTGVLAAIAAAGIATGIIAETHAHPPASTRPVRTAPMTPHNPRAPTTPLPTTIVEPGDSLSSIALRHGDTAVERLRQAQENRGKIGPGDTIHPGTVLVRPPLPDGAVLIRPGDTWDGFVHAYSATNHVTLDQADTQLRKLNPYYATRLDHGDSTVFSGGEFHLSAPVAVSPIRALAVLLPSVIGLAWLAHAGALGIGTGAGAAHAAVLFGRWPGGTGERQRRRIERTMTRQWNALGKALLETTASIALQLPSSVAEDRDSSTAEHEIGKSLEPTASRTVKRATKRLSQLPGRLASARHLSLPQLLDRLREHQAATALQVRLRLWFSAQRTMPNRGTYAPDQRVTELPVEVWRESISNAIDLVPSPRADDQLALADGALRTLDAALALANRGVAGQELRDLLNRTRQQLRQQHDLYRAAAAAAADNPDDVAAAALAAIAADRFTAQLTLINNRFGREIGSAAGEWAIELETQARKDRWRGLWATPVSIGLGVGLGVVFAQVAPSTLLPSATAVDVLLGLGVAATLGPLSVRTSYLVTPTIRLRFSEQPEHWFLTGRSIQRLYRVAVYSALALGLAIGMKLHHDGGAAVGSMMIAGWNGSRLWLGSQGSRRAGQRIRSAAYRAALRAVPEPDAPITKARVDNVETYLRRYTQGGPLGPVQHTMITGVREMLAGTRTTHEDRATYLRFVQHEEVEQAYLAAIGVGENDRISRAAWREADQAALAYHDIPVDKADELLHTPAALAVGSTGTTHRLIDDIAMWLASPFQNSTLFGTSAAGISAHWMTGQPVPALARRRLAAWLALRCGNHRGRPVRVASGHARGTGLGGRTWRARDQAARGPHAGA